MAITYIHQKDWLATEIAQIHQLRDALNSRYEMHCDTSDEGHPWCSFVNRHTYDVDVHLAKMDRTYYVATAHYPPAAYSDFAAAIDLAQRTLGIAHLASGICVA